MTNYLVFDVGGSTVKYAVINSKGDFLLKGSLPSVLDDFQRFSEEIMSLIAIHKVQHEVAGIAFSTPGGVDSDSGIIGGASSLPCIHGPNFKEVFGELSGLPVEIENDANCAALGEVWKGAAQYNQNVLFTVIGSGIGGAVIKDRRVHKGVNLHGGEVGYMVMDITKQKDKVAFRTWSEMAATVSLVNRVAAIKQVHAADLKGEDIFDDAEKGDPVCRDAIDDFYLSLAQGIYNLQYVYDPEKIILGGAISVRTDLIEQINRKIDLIVDAVGIAKIRPVIETCHFKNDANLLGALYHFLQCQQEQAVKRIS
ncbi:ROK family protein [Fictibacillus fluitans]|uniref:ROK family protein n=1 Tax=Fictibacillus fluitans TaxID=3058422 RepID=A0ABT8I0X3_9BACL|nr:ROK family protein [Fictibacillus sp. NE201]MDN4526674.1 ROK family protein [Fictibacillus sp. NE201]